MRAVPPPSPRPGDGRKSGGFEKKWCFSMKIEYITEQVVFFGDFVLLDGHSFCFLI